MDVEGPLPVDGAVDGAREIVDGRMEANYFRTIAF